MLGKKEKAATSGSTLEELTSVRFNYPVDINNEIHNFISKSSRVASDQVKAFLDAERNRIELRVETKQGNVLRSFVPLSNVASYR